MDHGSEANQVSEARRLWFEAVRSYDSFTEAVGKFLGVSSPERLGVLTNGYREAPSLTVALLADFASIEDLKAVLPFLLSMACSVHRYLFAFRSIILRIPKDWLRLHIEEAADPLLKNGDDETYRRLLELYLQVDPPLAARLANRACDSDDAETREVGSEFLDKLAL